MSIATAGVLTDRRNDRGQQNTSTAIYGAFVTSSVDKMSQLSVEMDESLFSKISNRKSGLNGPVENPSVSSNAFILETSSPYSGI